MVVLFPTVPTRYPFKNVLTGDKNEARIDNLSRILEHFVKQNVYGNVFSNIL